MAVIIKVSLAHMEGNLTPNLPICTQIKKEEYGNECHFCLRLNVTFRVLRVATQFSCSSSPKFLDFKLNLRDLR